MNAGIWAGDLLIGPQENAMRDADGFARALILAVCADSDDASGARLFGRCIRALEFGATARAVLRHSGKAQAIDAIWRDRRDLFPQYLCAADRGAFLRTLPWIGAGTVRRIEASLTDGAALEHRKVELGL